MRTALSAAPLRGVRVFVGDTHGARGYQKSLKSSGIGRVVGRTSARSQCFGCRRRAEARDDDEISASVWHVARFARAVRDAGFSVYMPSLYGRDGAVPGFEEGVQILKKAC